MRVFSGILLVVVAATLGPLAALSADGDDTQLRRLVAGLASPDFREREAATRELDRIGDRAVDALRGATQFGDAEARRRAGELVERIRRRQAAAHLLAPACVTLNYQKTPLIDAVADLAKRTGTPITVHGDPAHFEGRTVTVVSDKATYWQALDLFCHRAGLREWDGLSHLPQVLGDAATPLDGVQVIGQMLVRRGQVSALTVPSPSGRIALLDGPVPASPGHLAGSVRVRALPHGVSFPADFGKDQFVVLRVTAEPRLRIDGASDLRIERAIDDHGRSLNGRAVWADPPDERDDWPRGTRPPPQVTERRAGPVAIRFARDDSRRLRELTGVVTVQAFAAEKAVEVARPSEAVKRPIRSPDGVVFTIQAVEAADGGDVRLRAEVQLPYGVRLDLPVTGQIGGGNRNGFGRGWVAFQADDTEPAPAGGDDYQGLMLEDANGRRWAVTSGSTEVAGLFPQWFTVRMTATFHPPATDADLARVVFRARRPVAIDVPFTLRDVPLP
jgi:hypothetical protein